MLTYTPHDWYWIIGGDAANVWSSARAALVPVDDPDYLVWLSINGNPSTQPTMSDVEYVLRDAFPPGTPRTYAADARYRKASGGVIVTSLGGSVPFLSDPVSRNTVASAQAYATANPATITHWKLSDGTFIPLDLAQLTTLVNAMASFVQSCFTEESSLSSGITGGTITTIAQIDAAFAAISNVFP